MKPVLLQTTDGQEVAAVWDEEQRSVRLFFLVEGRKAELKFDASNWRRFRRVDRKVPQEEG